MKLAKRKEGIKCGLNLELCSVLSKKCGLKNIFSKPQNLFSPAAEWVNASRKKDFQSRKIQDSPSFALLEAEGGIPNSFLKA